MDAPRTYCDAVKDLDESNVHRRYHDFAYGFPIADDDELFERFVLEINQAGLSWTTILNKQANFRKAYHGFKIRKVAAYGESDRQRLLADAGMVRNRLKVDAAIHNAKIIMELQNEFGSFKNWLDRNHPKSRSEWTAIFKKTFKFVGGEIVNEFLLSSGYLPGAHVESCCIYERVMKARPPWAGSMHPQRKK